jgi:hypothetical protein
LNIFGDPDIGVIRKTEMEEILFFEGCSPDTIDERRIIFWLRNEENADYYIENRLYGYPPCKWSMANHKNYSKRIRRAITQLWFLKQPTISFYNLPSDIKKIILEMAMNSDVEDFTTKYPYPDSYRTKCFRFSMLWEQRPIVPYGESMPINSLGPRRLAKVITDFYEIHDQRLKISD